MRSAAWRRVAGLFDSVVDLAPAEREARIREMAGSDRTLVREVRELVRASGRSGNGDFIAATVTAMANEMTVGRTEKEASDPQRPSSSSRSDPDPSSLAASSGRPAAR